MKWKTLITQNIRKHDPPPARPSMVAKHQNNMPFKRYHIHWVANLGLGKWILSEASVFQTFRRTIYSGYGGHCRVCLTLITP